MDIQLILENHHRFLSGNGGERANLSRASLFGANLFEANLSEANLFGANLSRANLSRANLSGANLSRANLSGANLFGANLFEANLSEANLFGANLPEASLSGANLSRANLSGANLSEANLFGASLPEANLSRANLSEANLSDTILPHFQIVPATGSFYAWKKTTKGIIKIRIPAEAKRTSTLVGRKCRASHVIVVSGVGCGGMSPTNSNKITYNKGAEIYADMWDDDIRVECTHGIHFFMTQKEAEEW